MLWILVSIKQPKELNNIILGLQGAIQTETRKMVDIVSNYHKQPPEKPQLNMAGRRAINKVKKHIK